jgi:hypothetical protein
METIIFLITQKKKKTFWVTNFKNWYFKKLGQNMIQFQLKILVIPLWLSNNHLYS